MRRLASLALILAAACLASCASSSFRSARTEARLFDGMGTHTRTVSTTSPLAQQYFNQGLIWAYAFNHDEAIRSFTKAAQIDPSCAMAWWGVALCHGPHINNPAMSESRRVAAWDALTNALARRDAASPVERALIDALATRYSADPAADRAPLDAAYAAAMRTVYDAYPDDADIATLYAESMMDLRPWNLWASDGSPHPGTPELVAALEHALALDPNHPGACHLYIHAVEASPDPSRAVPAADRLRAAVPAAGHLVHMPSHIDVRVGQWEQASSANVRAIAADAEYRRATPRAPDFYRVYMAHNAHFLAFSSMMQGRESDARRAARDMLAPIPSAWLRDNAPMADPSASIELEVLVRFGRWREVLDAPAPATYLPITTAMWRFCRGVAFAASGDPVSARLERRNFVAALDAIPPGAMMAINPAHTVLTIARHKLDAEIALAEGDLMLAAEELARGVAIEDTLTYMEPPDWLQPVRHPLGAVLLKAGRSADAERVYREDLARWPENVWSLAGLERALAAQGRQAEAAQTRAVLALHAADADEPIDTSCKCVPGESLAH